MEHIPEEIIREWIEKAKPLVDSAWDLALDEAIRAVETLSDNHSFTSHPLHKKIITSLSKLKNTKA